MAGNRYDERYASLVYYTDTLSSNLAENGLYYDVTEKTLKCSECRVTFESLIKAKNTHKLKSPACIFNQCGFFIESERLASFHSWPKQTEVPVELFKRSGLFFTGKSDITQCAFCDSRLNNWQQNDHPLLEIAKWHPTCPYVRGTETRNIHDTTDRSTTDTTKCKVCLINELKIMTLPCAHIATCNDCSPHLQFCVVCRSLIVTKKRIYLA